MRAILSLLGFTLLLTGGVEAQQATRTEPVTGIRDNGTGFHALVGARVVTAPGQVLDDATIVIRNGLIQGVGGNMQPPPVHASGTWMVSRSIRVSLMPMRTWGWTQFLKVAMWDRPIGTRRFGLGLAPR